MAANGDELTKELLAPEQEAIANASHPARLTWMRSFITEGDRVLEIGCGTGWGVTLPLRLAGVDIIGTDLDRESVAHGREVFARYGLDGDAILLDIDAQAIEGNFDVVILSEVFEHLTDPILESMLNTVREKLKPNGLLLVTTPNGYGWFELEQAIWTKLGVGRAMKKMRMGSRLMPVRERINGVSNLSTEPNTLSSSPHVQRFTLRKLTARISEGGLTKVDVRGSSFFAGPFTASIFTGVRSFIRLNDWLGKRFPRAAADFYVAARRSSEN